MIYIYVVSLYTSCAIGFILDRQWWTHNVDLAFPPFPSSLTVALRVSLNFTVVKSGDENWLFGFEVLEENAQSCKLGPR